MPFVPPLFKNFGKIATTLFEDKYKVDGSKEKLEDGKLKDFEHRLIVTSNAAPFTLTSKVSQSLNGHVGGTVTVKLADKKLGDAALEVQSNTELKFTANAKLDQVQPGLKATSEVKSGKVVVCKGALEYAQEFVAAHVEIENKPHETKPVAKTLLASVAVGFEGFSVGGSVKQDLNKEKYTPILLAGMQYSESDVTVALKMTEDGGETGLAGQFFQKVNSTWSHGVQYKHGGKAENRGVYVGGSYVFDANTNAKLNVKIPPAENGSYSITSLISHKLANPSANLGFSFVFDPKKPSNNLFGVSVSLGDN